ncbi:MAG: hypothetical protein JNL74_21765 [Fibrobacteres bacterium]|nr:hypothetical protein [Fibrobacterota bacterium]
MKRKIGILFVYMFAAAQLVNVFAQESLQSSLQEESDYYENYGKKGFAKKAIEKQKIPYFDKFGSHVVNGYLIYGLETNRNNTFDTDDDLTPEVTDSAYSNMFQTSVMSDNFNNVVIAQDALGEMKSMFLVGSQIQTRFTPLTMNKLNFQGVRWDIWTSSLKFTTVLSRTRPFIMAQNDISGRSYIGFDRTDLKNWQGVKSGDLLPDEEYIRLTAGANSTEFIGRRDGWILQYDKWADFSNKSVYGDYDILWGLHGQTNIANIADVGVTYLNHHRSDIKKGEKIFSGDLPDDYAPEEIHFEIYDLTADQETDLGARVHDFNITVNGRPLGGGDAKYYAVSSANGQLVNANTIYEIVGKKPLIVVFDMKDIATRQFGGLNKVKSIEFNYTVSGNYLVFVSTDKLVSYGYAAVRSVAGDYTFEGPFKRRVEEMRNKQTTDVVSGQSESKPIGGEFAYSDGAKYTTYANTWFGDYIAKAPRVIYLNKSATPTERAQKYESSRRSYSYTYSINKSSVTMGIDFKGKLMGVKFDGELVLNKKDYKYPGGDDDASVYRPAAYVRFEKDILANVLAARGMLYNVAPEYNPAMDIPQVSQHFSYAKLNTRSVTNVDFSLPDYLFYPQHFNNNFHMLDDNDDEDLYVESDRVVYPGDLGSGNAANRWMADGTFASYKASERDNVTMHRKANYTMMPNGMYTFYGDDDGVYVDRFDRNRNGLLDYKEDFFLYQSDPPIFSLDNDADNNGVWDVEDDDLNPDMPNGIKVSYVLTSNGFKSQGVRGANLKLVYSPSKSLEVGVSALYEKALDLDINKSSDDKDELGFVGNGTISYDKSPLDVNQQNNDREEQFEDSKNLGLKASALLNVVKRSMGLEYFAGAELQYLRDNIRNDVMKLQEIEEIEYLYQDYYYQTDELRFRNAALANVVGGVTYNNIPNFTWNAKVSLGGVKKIALEDTFYTVRTLRNAEEDTTYYNYTWEPYRSATFGHVYFVNKFDYLLKLKLEGKGLKGSLYSFLNRITINPQYKFVWSYKTGNEFDDPRNIALIDDRSETVTAARLDWGRYRLENENVISSIPIIRADFRIAEKTKFQYGVQWKRDYDQLVKEESNSRTVQTFQVYTSDIYNGYNVVLILGMNLITKDYDILDYDNIYQTGYKADSDNMRFFINVYAGN